MLRRKIIIILVVGLFVVSLNFFQKEVRNFFYLISSPIQKWLWRAGDSASDFLAGIFGAESLKAENEDLQLKIKDLIGEKIRLQELKKENESLRGALNLGLAKEFKLKLAEVIGKDVSQDVLTINKGSDDGLATGQPVITPQKVLVGKIGEVSENFSKVILTTNRGASFDAKIREKDVYGVIKGRGNSSLGFELVSRDKNVERGDFITTGSLGGVFPPDLLAGQVDNASRSDVEPFQKIEVKPAFQADKLNEIFIVVKF